MRKRILSIITVLALCLGLLPVTALATAPDGQVIYVGNENVTSGGYWTTDSNGNVTAYTGEGTPTDNYIHYDADTNTLTLHNATIKKSVSTDTSTLIAGTAIGVLTESGDAKLTITLEGTNTIAEVSMGIYVLAISQSTGSSSLTIMGNGSLDTSSSQTGIWVQSNSNDAALSIKNAKVTATIVDSYGSDGVRVQSEGNFSASLTVDGGSLTATGSGATFAGIQLLFGSGGSVSGTPTVTVSGNAVVDAKNSGIANNSSSPIQYKTGSDSTGGIVFNGNTGTVYGNVTLQKNLEIGEGESLKLDDGASLAAGGHNVIVDGGTLDSTLAASLGDSVIYKVTKVELDKTSLTLTDGGTAQLTATVEPDDATNRGVTWESSDTSVATVNNGVVTAVAPGTATITATAKDGSGKSATCTVTVTAKPSPDRPVITRPSSSRISGGDRFETAMETADQLKKELGVTEFSAIVVACSDDFADALSASAFAHENEAPILVVNENNEERVKTYIEQNLAKDGTVYIMGGSAAVTGGFEDSLSDFDTVRFAGDDRYETNLNTLKELNLTGKEDIIIASGKDFADALSASSTGCPIMIVGERLTEPQIAFLKTLGGDDTYCIAGGTAAVSVEVEEQLRALNAGSVKRLAGEDRYETGVLIAETFYGRTGSVYIASGDDFPDGLTGGVLAGLSRDGKGAPLILVNRNNTERAAEYIDDVNPRTVKAIGGKAAVPDDVLKAVIS